MSSLRVLCASAVLFAGCSGGGANPAPTESGPSGSLGVITAAAAAEVVGAICDLRETTDRDRANGLFFDRAHQTLHVLAAATEVVDRVAAAGLLEVTQAVEADLLTEALPKTIRSDVGGLLDGTRNALRAIDLPAPGC